MRHSGGILFEGMVLLSTLLLCSPASAQKEDRARWFQVRSWTGTIQVRESFHGRNWMDHNINKNRDYNIQITYGAPRVHPDGDTICWEEAKGSISVQHEDRREIFTSDTRELLFTQSCEGSGTVPIGSGRLCIDFLAASSGDYFFHLGGGPYTVECETSTPEAQHPLTQLMFPPGWQAGTREDQPSVRVPDTSLPASGLTLTGRYVDEQGAPEGQRVITWSLQPSLCGGSADIPEVVIDEPMENDTFTFRGIPGELGFFAAVQPNPEVPESDLQWSFPEIAGSRLTTTPDDRRGRLVELRYEGMPESNDAFGDKEVSVILVPYQDCMDPVTRPIRVFFARDGYGNPDGNVPNWFYYWLQTKAGQGLDRKQVQYKETTEGCDRLLGWFDGYLDPDVIFVCKNAKETDVNFLTGRWTDGIDTFAVTVIHEWRHKTDYEDWWGAFDSANRGRPDYWEKRSRADRDGDAIPDDREEALGFDPNKKDTRNLGYRDVEYPAYEAEASWTVGAADHEDWARPGKQSGGR